MKYCITFELWNEWEVIDARTFYIKAKSETEAHQISSEKLYKAGCGRWDINNIVICVRTRKGR